MPAVDVPPTHVASLASLSSSTLKPLRRTRTQGVHLLPLLLSAVQVGGALFVVWLVGYWGFSLTWVLVGLLVYVGRDEYAKSKKGTKEFAQQANVDERQAILARVDELPSWVSSSRGSGKMQNTECEKFAMGKVQKI